MEIKISNEFKNLIPPLERSEKKILENSLKNEGVREPLITWNNILIDGHNRYEICKKENIKFKIKERKFKDKNEVLLWIINNQLGRRNLHPYDRTRLELKKENYFKVKAKENQGTRTDLTSTTNVVNVNTNKEIGKLANVSHNTVAKVKFIEKKATEKEKKKLREGIVSINGLYTKTKKRFNLMIAKPIKAPKGKYNIIYADPPWEYKTWTDEGGHKSASAHYPTMNLEKIKELNTNKIADKDCVLFLWATFPNLKQAFEVIDAWGFNYKTVGFVWIKKYKNKNKNFVGLGYWTRANSEICLIATKGNIKRINNNIHQIIESKIEEHSKKPDIIRDKIVELMGDIPRIELFARKKTLGWDVWGNEI